MNVKSEKMSVSFFLSKVEQCPYSIMEMDVSRKQETAMEKRRCFGEKTFVFSASPHEEGWLGKFS